MKKTMLSRRFRQAVPSLLAALALPAAVQAGTYTNDFRSATLTGANLYGNDGDDTAGVIDAGVLKLTKQENGAKPPLSLLTIWITARPSAHSPPTSSS